ncbi:MAG: MucR family transcriptional regulator [Deltaproteobacteria bacterium]|nr:MucR family transcriptional regulator [Deltaproteobacteria bacterium]MDH3963274.1 MucR family transcriptional regulator [Deltaproteobacteria bacterium]
MAKSLTQMAANIVAAQASHVSMSADEMDAALKKVFEALNQIKVIEETPAGEAVDDELARLRANPIKSIQRTYVINLEDGSKYKQITAKTLAKFGLTAKEYRKKWGFSARQPLSAKALSAKRRKVAKDLGLADKLAAARLARSKTAAERKAAPATEGKAMPAKKKKAAPVKKKKAAPAKKKAAVAKKKAAPAKKKKAAPAKKKKAAPAKKKRAPAKKKKAPAKKKKAASKRKKG